MGRLGKVASPALRGNGNPRLMRHKLTDTTFRNRPNTFSSQNASSPVGAAAALAAAAPPHQRPWKPRLPSVLGVLGARSRAGPSDTPESRPGNPPVIQMSNRSGARRGANAGSGLCRGPAPSGLWPKGSFTARYASSWHGRAEGLSSPRCRRRPTLPGPASPRVGSPRIDSPQADFSPGAGSSRPTLPGGFSAGRPTLADSPGRLPQDGASQTDLP
jgi:hypothetical protein